MDYLSFSLSIIAKSFLLPKESDSFLKVWYSEYIPHQWRGEWRLIRMGKKLHDMI